METYIKHKNGIIVPLSDIIASIYTLIESRKETKKYKQSEIDFLFANMMNILEEKGFLDIHDYMQDSPVICMDCEYEIGTKKTILPSVSHGLCTDCSIKRGMS
jgi:hypothetical protein